VVEIDYRIEPLVESDEAKIEAMYALYSRYYGGTSEELFRRDLSDKTYMVALRDKQGRMQGFSTVAVSDHRIGGEKIRSIYSGDTIVDHQFRGHKSLPAAFLRLAGHFRAGAPELPLFWYFLVTSERSYRFLRAYFKTFYPAHDREIPAREQTLLDFFTGERFGDAYDPARGVVSFTSSQGYLRPEWAGIPDKVRDKADVRYFVDRNPGHVRGDGLSCMTELTWNNLKPRARPPFRSGMEDGI
jgi:hypothetical protein